VDIGEVAAPTARHQDLLADPVGTFEDNGMTSAIAGGNRTHEPGGTATDYNYVRPRHGGRITGDVRIMTDDPHRRETPARQFATIQTKR
jgi:hypothetical protein